MVDAEPTVKLRLNPLGAFGLCVPLIAVDNPRQSIQTKQKICVSAASDVHYRSNQTNLFSSTASW